jgi:hypothetical protein
MTNPSRYRPDLPPIPARMLTLAVERGFPVPWFVGRVDDHYDFRLIGAGKLAQAIQERRCWVCGGPLGGYLTSIIGCMCAINRTISEPPSHRDCAEFSAKACPFLTQRQAERRTIGLPDPSQMTQAAGFGLARQPGVVCLWTARSCRPFRVSARAIAAGAQPGVLFALGEPTDVRWYREGRAATPAEIYTSVTSGLPTLRELARQEGTSAVLALERQIDRFLALVPGDTGLGARADRSGHPRSGAPRAGPSYLSGV